MGPAQVRGNAALRAVREYEKRAVQKDGSFIKISFLIR